MRGQEPLSDDVAASPRPGGYVGADDADSAPRRNGVDTATPSAPSSGASPKFEDWLLGVASWYVSHEGTRMAADKTPVPAGQ